MKRDERHPIKDMQILKTVIEYMPSGVTIMGPDATIRLCNQNACKLLGQTEDQLLQRTAFDEDWAIYREDGTPMPQEELPVSITIKSGKSVKNIVLRVYHPTEDQYVWLLVNSEPVFDEDTLLYVMCIFNDITAQKKTEESLRESEKRYRLLADNIEDVLWTMDLNGKFTYVSPSVERLRGYTPEEVLQQSMEDALCPPSLIEARKGYWEVIKSIEDGVPMAETPVFELEQPTKDGGTVWTQVIARPIKDIDGNISIMGVSRNITEQRKIKQHYQSTFEQAAVGMAHVDLDGRYIQVNKRYCEITGYEPEELLQLTFKDTSHPDDMDASNQYVRELLAGARETFDLEKRIRHKQGSDVWVEVTASLVRNPDGTPLYIHIVVQDIGLRKIIQEALEESELRYRSIFENASMGIFRTTLDGRFISLNPAAARMLGYNTPEEAIMAVENLAEQVYANPEDRKQTIRKALKNGHQSDEVRFLRKNGEEWLGVIQLTTVHDGSGNVVYLDGIVDDVTEKRLHEVQRFTLLAEQERVRALSKFVEDVSHDLRTPLATIGTNVYLLSKIADAEKRERYVASMEHQIDRVKQLLDSMLTMSRLQNETLVYETEAVDSFDLINRALGKVSESIRAKRHEIMHEHGKTLPVVNGNPAALEQAVTNVLQNAVNYTPEDGKITVRCYLKFQFAIIEVEDTGIGIPEEELPFIFDSFYRGDTSRGYTTHAGVNGLGLAITRKIVELHGGYVEVKSTPDVGSIFRILLPVIRQEARA